MHGLQVKELLIGIPLLMFILWVFIAPLPEQRIERVCAPITWVGNLTTSTTALTKKNHTDTAATWADKLDYSCQYLIWRLIYQKDYNEAIKAGLIKPESRFFPLNDEEPESEDASDPSTLVDAE